MRLTLIVLGGGLLLLIILDLVARRISVGINSALNTDAFTQNASGGGLMSPSTVTVVAILMIVCLVAAVMVPTSRRY